MGQTQTIELECVYCGNEASTWDHLYSLVQKGAFTGYGHQLGNLVPCCKKCNSSKGSKNYSNFIDSLPLAEKSKIETKAKLENYISAFDYKTIDVNEESYLNLIKGYDSIKSEIFQLMKLADLKAEEIRNYLKDN